MQWTGSQRAAIEARGSNLLVSAAAGSGKTTVLAARILLLIQEGVRVDDLLVVTFTKAAAAEMRGRIMSMLHGAAEKGDGRLAQEAMRVERADITTLHSFCSKVCRDHFQAAGVDPAFRVADAAEAGVLRAQAVEEALIGCYEAATPAFSHAAACLTRVELENAVGSLHTFLMARSDPWEWLDWAIAMYAEDEAGLRHSAWMNVLEEKLRLLAEEAVDLYGQAMAFSRESGLYEAFTLQEAEQAGRVAIAAQEGLYSLLACSVSFGRKPRKATNVDPDREARYVALRDAAKEALQDTQKQAETIAGLLERGEALENVGQMLAGIGEVTRAFHDAFARLKEEKNVLDFHDLEHFALCALRNAEVAEALQKRYKYIFIDEYQDSSHLQEAILSCVKREDNLFMVGDVKQSIYRFRLAEPGLFLDKLMRFSPEEGMLERKIDLNTNYRSHKMLLNCVNQVFDRVFSGGVMEITYGEDSRLVAGKKPGWSGAPVELHLLNAMGEKEEVDEDAPTAEELTLDARQAIAWEADVIAERILALRDAPEGGYDFKDMAILMRAVKGKAAKVVETLRSRGINAWTDLGENALDRTEVQTVLALLKTVDNMRQDVPLLASLRGPALGLSEESLAVIRASQPEGAFVDAMLAYAEQEDALALALRGFIQRIRGWAMDAQALPLDALLRRLYEETEYYAEVGALPEGVARQANLRALAEHAGAYQRAQFGGLSGFLRYVERVKAREGLAAVELGEADNVVRVLSIHKSKGLQFPVVFVAGMGTRFRLKDMGQLQLHGELGAALPTMDPALRTKWTTLAQEAILEKAKREALAEEARVLYVAMTRAEERLILIGTQRKGDEDRWKRVQTVAGVAGARSQLDWVAPCALTETGWAVERHEKRRIPMAEEEAGILDTLMEQVWVRRGTQTDAGKILEWKPPVISEKPLKQGVTEMLKVEAPSLSIVSKRPLFMEEKGLTPTERGDAVHIFLRAVPLNAEDLPAVCRSMLGRGLLSQEQADSLPLDRLERCMRSGIWSRMAAAETIHREWAFNLRMQEGDERTLLQGVIDVCFLEDGEWVLVDYKTDHVGDLEALIERYRPQVVVYAKALERITGRRVKERILFLLEKEAGFTL